MRATNDVFRRSRGGVLPPVLCSVSCAADIPRDNRGLDDPGLEVMHKFTMPVEQRKVLLQQTRRQSGHDVVVVGEPSDSQADTRFAWGAVELGRQPRRDVVEGIGVERTQK